ncbi:erythromycin esterase family protein [Acidaminobacter sp. JC074]|uniref:hypothetical protein n=1 Tax=Acidaminobacter sp. JC074 TaxID=2530199 RepID=UPI001F0F1C94|nr:hypothetical protein [Acidaminobacter sp. JC074]MCH4890109.1 erythromycin esterase family protein [Acidaminobacter sp. JC074]
MKKLIIYLALISSVFIGCQEATENSLENTVPHEVVVDKELNESVEEETDLIKETELEGPEVLLSYFKDNSKAITNLDSLEEGLISMEDLDQHEIFLTGEVHGIKANSDLNIAFVKYFKEETNFKYYLSEMPYSMSYFLNQFLESGDETILLDIFKDLGKYGSDDKEYYEFWTNFYSYNYNLADEEKIKVVGLDIESNIIQAYKCLLDMLPDEEAPIEIKESISSLGDILELLNTSFRNNYKGEKNAEAILEDMGEHRDLYKDYLGENYVYFELVLWNILNSKKAYKVVDDWVEWNNTRDRIIYDNFKTIDNVLPRDNYYGQWGAGHVFQDVNTDVKWFATYLNKYPKYQDKVLSITYNYLDCQMKSADGLTEDFVFILPFIDEIKDQIDSDFSIYKVNGQEEDRPYMPMYDILTGDELNKDVSEYFQYIVLIKNSGPTHTFNQ